jgi:hypothetical protein
MFAVGDRTDHARRRAAPCMGIAAMSADDVYKDAENLGICANQTPTDAALLTVMARCNYWEAASAFAPVSSVLANASNTPARDDPRA